MKKIKWIPISVHPPVGEDYGGFTDSIDVLITDGTSQWVGYHHRYELDEFPASWRMKGRDGYEIPNATHWRHLPKLPLL